MLFSKISQHSLNRLKRRKRLVVVAISNLVLPSLMVMLRSNSFLKRTVWTPEIAFTTVDLPWATCPIVPMLMVACREMTSGDRGVSFEMS